MPLPQFEGFVPPISEEPPLELSGSFLIPNDPEWMATFLGAMRVIIERQNWDEVNANNALANMDKIIATAEAIYFSIAFEGSSMSCEDIADCIESSEAVQTALLAQMTQNGFTPSPDNADADSVKPMPITKTTQSMLPDGFDCSTPSKNMAISRWIVREMHESVNDVFEQIALATSTIKAANIATDGTPILGTLNNVTEMAVFLQEQLAVQYAASYNQAAEDEISCAIFCHLETDCSLSLDELIDIYAGVGGQVPATIDDLQAAMTETINFTLNVSVATVATAHLLLLVCMRFGGEAFGMTGWNYLANGIRSAAEWNDYTYDECDECPVIETPTTYWRLYHDFTISPYDWVTSAPTNTVYNAGVGFDPIPDVGVNVVCDFQLPDLGANYIIRGWYTREMRRGSTGVAGDQSNKYMYPNVNYGGTVQGFQTTSGVTANTNNIVSGARLPSSVYAARSLKVNTRNAGVPTTPALNWTRVYQNVIWGVAGVGDTKPPHSEWCGNVLPTDPEDFFP